MQCGAEDFACLLAAWLKENDYLVTVMTKWLGDAGSQSAGALGVLSVILKLHGEKFIALAGLSFGLYKWWVYREKILHERLKEYLSQDKRTLGFGLAKTLGSLSFPGKHPVGKFSLYADSGLKSVLRERRWHQKATLLAVETSAQLQLARAINDIQERLKTSELNLSALRNQLATAQIVHGAIYSAKARRAEVTGSPLAHTALSFYRQALTIPEHENSVIAKELEAHELRRLGEFKNAREAYEALEASAPTSNDYRSQRLLIARAKRYQALMIQAECSLLSADGERNFQASRLAHQKLLADPDSVIAMRANFAPYQDFDLIEQGDLHYAVAFVAHHNGYVLVESRQINQAESCYQGLAALSPSTWRDRKRARQLQSLAKDGLARVAAVKPENGNKKYDWRWLLTN